MLDLWQKLKESKLTWKRSEIIRRPETTELGLGNGKAGNQIEKR